MAVAVDMFFTLLYTHRGPHAAHKSALSASLPPRPSAVPLLSAGHCLVCNNISYN